MSSVPQLPPAPARFVNREAELAELDRLTGARGEGDARVVLVVGPPGIGKTATCIFWAYSNLDRFPDGVIYVDLGWQGFEAAVTMLLGELGIEAEGLDLDEKLRRYRAWSSGKRLLVLIDDPGEEEDVRRLVPAAPDSVVLVSGSISFHELPERGAELLALPPLDAVAATQLIAEQGIGRRGLDLSLVDRVVDLTGGVPLALEIAGHLIAASSDPPGDWLAQLSADIPPYLDMGDGEMMYAWAYRSLRPPAAQLYRRLAVHPGPSFTSVTAGVAAGVDPQVAQEHLGELSAMRMIDRRGGWSRFHEPLLRHARVAFEQDEPSAEQVAAAERIVDFYAVATIQMGTAIDPEHGLRIVEEPERLFGSSREALTWFEFERSNIRAVIEEASARGWNDRAWVIGDALAPALRLDRHSWSETLRVYELAAEAARRIEDPRAEARMYSHLAEAYRDLPDAGRMYSERARRILYNQLGGAEAVPVSEFVSGSSFRHWRVRAPELLVGLEPASEGDLTVETYAASGGESGLLRLADGSAVRAERHEESLALVWPARCPHT